MFLVVHGISPHGFLEDLHGYILYSCVCLCNCLYVVTEINSIQNKNVRLVITVEFKDKKTARA